MAHMYPWLQFWQKSAARHFWTAKAQTCEEMGACALVDNVFRDVGTCHRDGILTASLFDLFIGRRRWAWSRSQCTHFLALETSAVVQRRNKKPSAVPKHDRNLFQYYLGCQITKFGEFSFRNTKICNICLLVRLIFGDSENAQLEHV